MGLAHPRDLVLEQELHDGLTGRIDRVLLVARCGSAGLVEHLKSAVLILPRPLTVTPPRLTLAASETAMPMIWD